MRGNTRSPQGLRFAGRTAQPDRKKRQKLVKARRDSPLDFGLKLARSAAGWFMNVVHEETGI